MHHRLSAIINSLLAVLALALAACSPKQTQALLAPIETLGPVLAEESARAAGTKKSVAIISYDPSWGPPSSVEESFKAALKKQGVSVVATKSANLGDPMRSGEVGLKAADFFAALEQFSDAGAVVSFAGAPLLKPGETARLKPDHPPVLVLAAAALGNVPGVPGDRTQLGRLLDAKVIQLAIVDGADPAAPKGGADATHELFTQHYRILRRPD